MDKGRILSEKEDIEECILIEECYMGIPDEEDIERLNELQRRKLKRMIKKYGGFWAVNINLNPEYEATSKPLIKVTELKDIHAWDALIPLDAPEDKLKLLEKLIYEWNKKSLTKEGRKILDKIFDLIDDLGGYSLFWY